MPTTAEHAGLLPQVLMFLAAAVIGVPVARFAGLSAVLGYLVAGIAIGPSGFKLFTEPQTLTGIAELGIVMFLFLIGLELKLSRLMELRRDIFVLGLLQMLITVALIFVLLRFRGDSAALGIVAGIALALSATSIGLQMLEERGELQSPGGQKLFAILLFQDISVVPVLGLMPLLAPGASEVASSNAVLAGVASGIGAIAVIVLAGRYLLNIVFGLLARFGAREVMTAAALLVVLGSAVLMSVAGMSMALGAFLAGLLLAESNFRHELEADIEPFRGLLLGLFFLAIGMGIDLQLLKAHWLLIVGGALLVLLVKLVVIGGLLKASRFNLADALRFGSLLTPAGEFSFVLLPLAAQLNLIAADSANLFTGIAALSMLLGPVAAKAIDVAQRRLKSDDPDDEIEEDFEGAGGQVLVIGFGRFGQQVTQILLAANIDTTVIDKDIEQVRGAARFGFRVYYGDGTRLDVLRAAGATNARVICLCIDHVPSSFVIIEMIQANFPLAKIHVRAFDRRHAIDLMGQDVDYVVRETFEAAMEFGGGTLMELGQEEERALEIVQDVRKRDVARLQQQKAAGMFGGIDLLSGGKVQPEPLAAPKRKSRALTEETEAMIKAEKSVKPTADAAE